MNYELAMMNYELVIMNYELVVTNYELGLIQHRSATHHEYVYVIACVNACEIVLPAVV